MCCRGNNGEIVPCQTRAIIRLKWQQSNLEEVYVFVRWYMPCDSLQGSFMDVLTWDVDEPCMLIRAGTIIRPIVLHPHPKLKSQRLKPTAFGMAANKKVVHNMLFDDLP